MENCFKNKSDKQNGVCSIDANMSALSRQKMEVTCDTGGIIRM